MDMKARPDMLYADRNEALASTGFFISPAKHCFVPNEMQTAMPAEHRWLVPVENGPNMTAATLFFEF